VLMTVRLQVYADCATESSRGTSAVVATVRASVQSDRSQLDPADEI